MFWMCTFGNLKNKNIGTILYKYRMRSKEGLQVAIKTENKKTDIYNKRYDGQEKKSGVTPVIEYRAPKKVFEITIDKCV